MEWIVMKVTVEKGDEAMATELLTSGFAEFNIIGLTIETPNLEPLEGWGAGAQSLPPKLAAVAYLPASDTSRQKCREIEAHLASLAKTFDLMLTTTYGEIDEQDWAESWKAFFWPERVSQHLVIKPTWREYQAREADIVLEIDPGMAFGTGTHPTTRLCLNMIETYIKPEDRFLDIGTGSGILMMAAAKLGTQQMVGIDTDEVAVAVARENLELNQIAPERYKLVLGELQTVAPTCFDLITANILWEVIDPLLNVIPAFSGPQTTVIGWRR